MYRHRTLEIFGVQNDVKPDRDALKSSTRDFINGRSKRDLSGTHSKKFDR